MKIICIGRNYAEHVKELHNTAGGPDGLPTEPVFFLKPDTALLRNNDPFYIPSFSQEVHYECELVVRINRRQVHRRAFRASLLRRSGTGHRLHGPRPPTRGDRPRAPLGACQGFDHSAALSPEFIPLAELGGDVQRLHFELTIDGQVRQRGDTARMLFGIDRIIHHISQYITLKIGDLIYTGTPAGVGPVHPGDNLKASLEGHMLLDFDIRLTVFHAMKPQLLLPLLLAALLPMTASAQSERENFPIFSTPRRHTTYSPFFRRRTNSPKTRFSPAHWERTRCSSTGRTGSIRSSVLRNSATFTV